jgi:1,4-dihydroxy-2-naphthoyl-CoA hydrolase
MEPELPEDLAPLLNQNNSGWARAMDLHFVRATADEVIVEWLVSEKHLQPFGIVHGGVHAGVIETVCSLGAGIAAAKRGHKGSVVGLENQTSFLRAVRIGAQLRGHALPITRGRTTHVWSAQITDSDGRLIAKGSVRLLCVAAEALPSGTP